MKINRLKATLKKQVKKCILDVKVDINNFDRSVKKKVKQGVIEQASVKKVVKETKVNIRIELETLQTKFY